MYVLTHKWESYVPLLKFLELPPCAIRAAVWGGVKGGQGANLWGNGACNREDLNPLGNAEAKRCLMIWECDHESSCVVTDIAHTQPLLWVLILELPVISMSVRYYLIHLKPL